MGDSAVGVDATVPNESPAVPVTKTTTTTVQANPARPENWRTLGLVGGIIACAIVLTAYVLTGPYWGTGILLLAAYEAWSLVNAYREDTISEAIWFYANRPLIPLLFGLAIGIGIGTGYLGDPHVAARGFAIGLCAGHFFFSRQSDTTVSVEKGQV